MKKFNIIIALIALCLISCNKETFSIEENNNLNHLERNNDSYISNQMIIKYDASISSSEMQEIRNRYRVTEIKKCNCADPSLELWMFQEGMSDGISVEEKVITAKEDSDLEGVEFNSFIRQENPEISAFLNTGNVNEALQKIVSVNNNVTIAVIDTGVDYNYHGFENPFLYNNSHNMNNCSNGQMEDLFGWDFVNQDNDPIDDYGHGTIVTNFIVEVLEEEDINFQILPVKSFNESGNGNLFDVLCGFKYALNNPDVKIINMSFGWYNLDNELFKNYITESEGQVLLNTSAGNSSVDTDIYAHFPSTNPSENILSITALQEDMSDIKLADFSNYGNITVDIAAKGENIEFYVTPNQFIEVSGTSYSTAFASGFSGVNYSQGMTIEQLKSNILSNTVYHGELETLKHSSYIDY